MDNRRRIAVTGDLPQDVQEYLGGFDGPAGPQPFDKPGVWMTWDGQTLWHELSSWRGIKWESEGVDVGGRRRPLHSWCGEIASVDGVAASVKLPVGATPCPFCASRREDSGRPSPLYEEQ